MLLINPRSGDGKAERAGLVRECKARNIEPVVLRPGQDVVAEAEAAVAGGAQLIGLAGGDGSLALVAGVAARHRVPMVVVPAGTRNHLAMDLGLDRSDVTGALDAYGAAVERAVDLGEVNGRPFVNNVSLGLYAEIIRSPAYREAKLDTTLQRAARPGRARQPAVRPSVHGSGRGSAQRCARRPGLQQPLRPHPPTLASRPRLDSGRLGVITLQLPEGRPDPAFLAAIAAGRRSGCPDSSPGRR